MQCSIFKEIKVAKLTIIRGIPGSGKSTMAKKMINDGQADSHWETDMFFLNEKGEYIFDRNQLSDAHRKCQEKVRQDLEYNRRVIVSNTFVKKWEMQPYIDMAKELDVRFEILTAKGEFQNTHGVPEEVIVRMKNNWEY